MAIFNSKLLVYQRVIMTYHGCMVSSSSFGPTKHMLRKNGHNATTPTTESAQTKLCQSPSSRAWLKKKVASNGLDLNLGPQWCSYKGWNDEMMKMAAVFVSWCSCCFAVVLLKKTCSGWNMLASTLSNLTSCYQRITSQTIFDPGCSPHFFRMGYKRFPNGISRWTASLPRS